MKKLSFLFFVMLAISASSFAGRCIKVEKCDGGPDGYLWVNEGHTVAGGRDDHFLFCDEPGFSECEWMHPVPKPILTDLAASAIVESRIAQGNFSGSMDIEGGKITWSAESRTCYSYTIDEN